MTTFNRGRGLLLAPKNTRSFPISLEQLIGMSGEVSLTHDEATCVVLTSAEDRVPVTVVPTGQTPLARWRKRLFAFLYLVARPATSYYDLPPERVAELGRLIEL